MPPSGILRSFGTLFGSIAFWTSATGRDGSIVSPAHLALVREIEVTLADHGYATYSLGQISLPARRDDRLVYAFTHQGEHLVFYVNRQDLRFLTAPR
jgi:hypothetical protein